VKKCIERIVQSTKNPVNEVRYMNLRQSMRNGGGPACLRLRVVLNDEQLASINPRVIVTRDVLTELRAWVHKHYRDALAPEDLCDPKLLVESRAALDELTQILKLGSIYDFQKM
jgi:succinylarginine dihydrolase